MHDSNLYRTYVALLSWCRERDFAGHDPFDGLNSRLFQATPLKRSRVARLAWTQLFKRSPINLRSLALVPPERNAKGIALFALAALANLRRLKTSDVEMRRPLTGTAGVPPALATPGSTESETDSTHAETEARSLLESLCEMQLSGFSGTAWGYNFDWQGRAFFAPRGTPTVVPTAFAARAFLEAAQVFQKAEYLRVARRACDFILRDLHRAKEADDEVCFSYSPADRTRVFNASLLAAETLGSVGSLTDEPGLCQTATRAARYVVRRQHEDGSWAYGADSYQSWADNFHTAFVLRSLSRISNSCGQAKAEFEPALRRGYEYWRERFFLADGWPKYYPDRLYPADAHSAGAAITALVDLQWLDSGAIDLAEKIAQWTIQNLRSPSGFFYYQRRRCYTVRIPYLRWSEGWLAYGLARLMEGKSKK
jgi:hypothetical protein